MLSSMPESNFFPLRSLILKKLIIFLLLFILASGIIGPFVIGTRLLYGFYFFIYGNMGKLVLFSAIVFYLLTRGRLEKITPEKQINKITSNKPYSKNLFFIIIAIALTVLFFPVAKQLLTYPTFSSNLPLSIFSHIQIIAIPVFLAIGVFGPNLLIRFIKKFKQELLICLGLSIIFYFSIFYIWQFWPYLSALVLHIEYALLTLSFTNVHIIPPRTLFVQNFGVVIEESCSGLDSLFLFTTLYILIGILDWKKFNHKKLVLLFFFAAIGLFLVNILRIYLLLLSGVFISPVFTAQLFHTYLGMVLFIIYFILFWRFSYRWLGK